MTGSGDAVSVEIRAIVDKFIDDMKKAGAAAGDAGRDIGDGMKHAGSSAGEARAPFAGFTGVLKEYRSEMRQEARLGRFLAADIASMGIASKSAAGEITQFIGAFAIGGGFGIAIESVKMLISKFTEVAHEEDAAQAALKKYASDGAAQINSLIQRNDDLLKTKKQLRLEEAIGPILKDQIDLTNQLAVANGKYAEHMTLAVEASRGLQGRDRDTFIAAMVEKDTKAVEELTAALERKNGEIEIARKLVDQEFARISALAEQEKQRKDHAAALNAELDYRREALIAENVIDVALAKKDADRLQKAFDAAEAAKEEERAYRDMVRDEENIVGYDALHADYQFRAKDALKEQKQDWKDIRPVIDTIASDITSMLFDAKSLDDVLKDVARQVVQTAIQLGLKALSFSVLGFEHGGDVPSAAAGWDVPSASGGIPAVLHPREMVLPEKYAEVIRGAAAGGGGGGVTVQINGVIDGDHLMRVVHSRQFADAMKSARRMGRLP
jgi:hypothetical protein